MEMMRNNPQGMSLKQVFFFFTRNKKKKEKMKKMWAFEISA